MTSIFRVSSLSYLYYFTVMRKSLWQPAPRWLPPEILLTAQVLLVELEHLLVLLNNAAKLLAHGSLVHMALHLEGGELFAHFRL